VKIVCFYIFLEQFYNTPHPLHILILFKDWLCLLCGFMVLWLRGFVAYVRTLRLYAYVDLCFYVFSH